MLNARLAIIGDGYREWPLCSRTYLARDTVNELIRMIR